MRKRNMPKLPHDEWERLIEQWILGRNAERNRAILRRKLLDGLTFDALAGEFMLSRPQIVRIVYRGQDELFQHVKK